MYANMYPDTRYNVLLVLLKRPCTESVSLQYIIMLKLFHYDRVTQVEIHLRGVWDLGDFH